jgi:hypothetical protein
MNIGAAIFSILSNDATLVSALGGTTKIYPLRAAQGINFPYVVYKKISTTPNDTKDGVSTLDEVRMQFDFYGTSFDTLYTIEERARALLDKYRGTVESISIDSCRYLSENETWDNDDDINRISVDYSFRILRTATIAGAGGAIEVTTFDTQLFQNVTSSTITVTNGNLPSTDLDLGLAIYRDGRLLLNTIDFTVSGNVITLTLQGLGENFLVKYKRS